MNLERPIIFFDLETTGVDREKDRIVEICMIKVFHDHGRDIRTRRVNPTIPIPLGASEVHGIYDKDVEDMPTFKELAVSIHNFIKGCDLGGFNSNSFDIPMLYHELLRSGIDWDYSQHRFIDVGNIFKRLFPRTLEAAVKSFLKRDHDEAHGAEPDTIATVEVFNHFVNNYEIPENMDELHLYSNYDKPILDISGKFTLDNDGKTILFNFGAYRGEPAISQLGFLNWMLGKDFAPDTKKIIHQLLNIS